MSAENPPYKLPIPALVITAYTAKLPKQRKSQAEKVERKRKWDDRRNKTRINLGNAYQRWRELRERVGLKLDSELAVLLLDCYENLTRSSTSANNPSVSAVSKSSTVPRRVCSSKNTAHAPPLTDEVPEQSQDSIVQCVEKTNTMCPSCGCTSRIQNGSDCMSAQLCLQCEYRKKFIKGFNVSNQHQPGSIEVTIEPEVELEPEHIENHVSDNEEPEEPAQSKESDISDEEETADIGGGSSDEDWIPNRLSCQQTEEVKKSDSEEDSEEEELSEKEISSHGHRNRQLCAECGAFYVKVHICLHKARPYVCNVCGKRCVTERYLKAHSKRHNESYEHPCKYCLVTFKTRKDKLAHQEIHKNTENPFTCPDCPETFASYMTRKVHLKTHRGPQEFKCDICGIRFWAKCGLLRHKVIHTGVKPFECSVCQRTFNQAGHLKSHMRVHTGEKPYKCKYCEESFNHNVSLKSHIQRYHPFDLGDIMDENNPGSNYDTEEHSDTGADCVNIQKEQDTEEVQQENVKTKSKRFPPSDRPVGRPKKNKREDFNYKSAQSWCQNVKEMHESDVESEEHFTDSDSFYSGQKEEEMEDEQTVKKGISKYKNSSDSDFDPHEETKKPSSRGQSSGRPRGRPRKTANV